MAAGNVIFILPIYWDQSRKKKVLVSMNAYRNWHFTVSAKFKREFGELVAAQAASTNPITKPYRVYIDLYYKNSSCDSSNITPLIEKVLLDSLITAGILPSDTVKWHLGTTYNVAGQDKTNPRCEITIKEITNE